MLGRCADEHEGTDDVVNAGTTDQLPIVGEDVWLTVPPFSEFLRTVRLVAADAGSRAGLDYDEVEDFRIAVDELCHLLMSSTDHEILLSFGVVGRSALARGRAARRHGGPPAPPRGLSRRLIDSGGGPPPPAGAGPPRGQGGPLAPLGELSRSIIDSVADSHETFERDDEIGFSVMKERRSPAVDA